MRPWPGSTSRDARISADDLAGAADALAPVLSLPVAQRIHQIHDRLTRIRGALTPARYGQSGEVRALLGELGAFSEQPRPAIGS